MIKPNKNRLYFMLLCSLAFFSQTTGFDLYSHAISYYYYEQSIDHAYLFFDQVIFPRYGLLSVLYELASRAGIPIALFAFLLTSIANYLIIKTILSSKLIYIYDFAIILLIILLNLFYSGLSLVLLFLLAYIKTKKPALLLSGLFHPVGILLFTPIAIINKKTILYSTAITLFFIFLYYSGDMNFLYGQLNNSFKKEISLGTLQLELITTYERKKQEILAGLVFIIAAFIFRGRLFRNAPLIFNKKIKLKSVQLGATIFSLFIVVYMGVKPSPNLLTSIVSFDVNQVVYVAWFDWGERDSYMSHSQLYSERYRHVDTE